MKFLIALVLLEVFSMRFTAASAAPLELNSKPLHLGVAGKPEWEEFARRAPDAHRWETRFHAESNRTEATLFIQQDDVRHDWSVELNGKRLGQLFLMEADLVHTVRVPVGALRHGENLLAIAPPNETDDVVLRQISLDSRPLAEALSEATLSVSVTDRADGTSIPCRITIVDEQGALAPLLAVTNSTGGAPFIAVRPGVIYTGNGKARVGVRSGGYTIYASRGFEWGVATQQVSVAVSQQRDITLQLRREVATPGMVSCDTHVHTFTHSRHGDATLDERMLTLAGEGIELPIATDHNVHIDYSANARAMGVAGYFTPVTGNEVTTPAGHFNIFPVERESRVADFKITHWPTLMTSMRATPGVRVVVLNHPRNVHNNFQPFAATNFNPVTGENKRGAEFTFDAMEVLNSSAQQSDYRLVFRDWFALWNYGYRVTGVGSSDGHDVSRYIVGQGRTYITSADDHPGRIDVAAACSNLVAGRASVSMGLLTQLTVNDTFNVGDLATRLDKQMRVTVRVFGPSWVRVTNVALFANGVQIRETSVAGVPGTEASTTGEQANVEWTMPRPAHDVFLVAIATGPGVTAPFWAIPRPYQPTSPRWESRVIGATNPIMVDGDGDGRFSAARDYARKLVAGHEADPAKLFSVLSGFDEAVAAQAASLCQQAGQRLDSAPFAEATRSALPQIQRGFKAYLGTQE
jgi:hypothetical protein